MRKKSTISETIASLWPTPTVSTSTTSNLAASRNLTATINGTQVAPIVGGEGQTALVDPNGILQGYVANNSALTAQQAFEGFRLVAPTIEYGTGLSQRTVSNPEEFLQYEQTLYTSQARGNSGNEYVFTNGIDFGLEIKY